MLGVRPLLRLRRRARHGRALPRFLSRRASPPRAHSPTTHTPRRFYLAPRLLCRFRLLSLSTCHSARLLSSSLRFAFPRRARRTHRPTRVFALYARVLQITRDRASIRRVKLEFLERNREREREEERERAASDRVAQTLPDKFGPRTMTREENHLDSHAFSRRSECVIGVARATRGAKERRLRAKAR